MKVTRRVRKIARHLFRFCVVSGQLDPPRVRTVAERVAHSGRRESLAVLADFRRMVRLEQDRHRAIVESATSLPDDVRNDVRARLGRLHGAGIETSFTENPALVAGMRIRIGSDVYDGSVRARLAAIDAGLSE